MGYSLDAWLALGPGPAVAMFRSGSWPAWTPEVWQHESWAEAGALIDLDARELLFFVSADYARRRALIEACRRVWPGWVVRWAYNGISDVTDALGLDRAVVRREPWTNDDLFHWVRPGADDPPRWHYLVSVGAVTYWPAPYKPWEIGPALLGQLSELAQVAELPDVPGGGLHLDPVTRTAGVWSIDPVDGLAERFFARWPGWTLEFWDDRYQEQEIRCGAFRFVEPAADVRRLARRVLDHWLPSTEMFRDQWPAADEGYDRYYGTRDARLTVADLQRLVDLLLGPDAAPIDVAAHARKMHG
ncbi:hypothetical protein [Actinoplanes palleronii]|nr:hypothetical protein [Actinoplanes palleronii]